MTGNQASAASDKAKITHRDVATVLAAPLREVCEVDDDSHVLRLIRCSPIALDLYEELIEEHQEGPTLLQLARFLLALENKPYRDSYQTALWLVRQSEVGRRLHAELDRMVEDFWEDENGFGEFAWKRSGQPPR